MAADMQRLETREQAKVEFKALSGAAREAGVLNSMFGIFHDAGYKGLYGGLGADAIKARKGIALKEQLSDLLPFKDRYFRGLLLKLIVHKALLNPFKTGL